MPIKAHSKQKDPMFGLHTDRVCELARNELLVHHTKGPCLTTLLVDI